MTSDKQARANRRNGLNSTGPKTPEGKAAVRHNATTPQSTVSSRGTSSSPKKTRPL